MARPSSKTTAPQGKSEALRGLAPLLNTGMELAATVIFFGAIGWFIDKYANTAPFWFVALLMFGVVGGMIKFLRTVMKFTTQKPQTPQKIEQNTIADLPNYSNNNHE